MKQLLCKQTLKRGSLCKHPQITTGGEAILLCLILEVSWSEVYLGVCVSARVSAHVSMVEHKCGACVRACVVNCCYITSFWLQVLGQNFNSPRMTWRGGDYIQSIQEKALILDCSEVTNRQTMVRVRTQKTSHTDPELQRVMI